MKHQLFMECLIAGFLGMAVINHILDNLDASNSNLLWAIFITLTVIARKK